MYRIGVFAVLFIAFVFVPARTCLAQGGLPPGDYKATCQNIRVQGSRLNAVCQKRGGGWRNTSLSFRNCSGAIINDDGNLRCGQGGPPNTIGRAGGGWQGALPPGDYKRTCQNMRMNGDRLDASCQRKNGGWSNTSLRNVGTCRNGIVNDDGNLRCQR